MKLCIVIDRIRTLFYKRFDACPMIGDGSNAMKSRVYFDTYEDAETYSIQIAPSQDKRQCGNCW